MRLLRYSLSVLFLLCCSTISHAVSTVRVETKQIDGQTVFVFYHDRSVHLHTNFNTNLATVVANKPIKLVLDNENNLKKFAGSFSTSADGRGFSFATKTKYSLTGKIDGEKLTAIKLKEQAKTPEQQVEVTKPLPSNDVILPITQLNAEAKVKSIESDEADAPKKSAVVVSYTKTRDGITIQFPFKNKPRAAVFKRGKYIWLVFDTYTEFVIQQNDYIENYKQVPGDVTILKISASKLPYISTSTTPAYWNLNLSKTAIKNSLVAPTKVISEPQQSIIFQNNLGNPKVIEFQDPDVGDTLRAVVASRVGAFITKPRSAVDFQLLPSFQGLGLALTSDSVTIDITKDNIAINSHYEIPDAINNANVKPTPIASQTKISSMLPIITNALVIKSFTPILDHLWQSIVSSHDDLDNYNKKLDLSQFYFMHGLYHESLAVLNLASQMKPGDFDKNTVILFQKAVTLTMLGKYKEAKIIYDKLGTVYNSAQPEEMTLFRNYNEYMLGNTPLTIGLIGSLNKFVSLYPEDLYWPLAFAEIDLCLQNNNLRTLEALFKSLRTPPNKTVLADTLKFYKANYYRKKDQINLAKQLLIELIGQKDDLYNATRAELELVKILYNANDIDANKAIERLDKIRFDWRGDRVEFDLLLTIAELYKDNNEPINAMRTYKYMLTAFDNQFHNFYISSEMVKIYNSIFLPGGTAEKMNDFDAVALFYEFRDLTPIGTEGDNVILMIAKKLINLDLLDTAAQLLKHQVDYRLSGEKKVINADHLALVYIMDNHPQDAVNILNSTDKSTTTFKEYIYRQQLKAKAFIDLGKYNDALSYLPDSDQDPISQTMRKEAYFKAGKWKDYIEYAKPSIDEAMTRTIKDNAVQDVLRLAIAYAMLGKTPELEALKKDLKTDNMQLKAIIDFLLVTNQPVDYRNLDKSLNIDQMRQFLNDSKKRLFK